MSIFIQDVLSDLEEKSISISEVVFVLPSKRAGIFLIHELKNRKKETFLSPTIISIEDFVEELSGLKLTSDFHILFQFYTIYIEHTPQELQEGFDQFSKWAQIVIQDFNEIDRFLIEPDSIFNYLKAIKEVEHWSLSANQTAFTRRYLNFWNNLKVYYASLNSKLLEQRKGYQGLLYKEAINNLETYIEATHKQHVFLGYNALNKAEEQLIQGFLHGEKGMVYWDVDEHFLNNDLHEVGFFLKHYKSHWPYYRSNAFNWISSDYNTFKNIHVIGCPKQIGQAKKVGNILSNLIETNTSLEKTALVLGDESLLLPVINSLPSTLKDANITMGLPLKSVPLASFFENLLRLHMKETSKLYYKDILQIVSDPMIQFLIGPSHNIKDFFTEQNIIHISFSAFIVQFNSLKSILHLLFSNWENSINTALKHCSELIFRIKEVLQCNPSSYTLELEYLYRFHNIFNEISNLNEIYPYVTDIKTLYALFKELLNSETLDFKGEPLEGLQIMGMLESRVLDFETVIITSVNEGILPAGKTTNSFIPYDVKIENGLPTYKEKDAVYAFHFYHLLQRAKNIYILYNTEVDALNTGEKSRFITQLEIENVHKINHSISSPSIPKVDADEILVNKTPAILDRILEIMTAGFSPSSLSSYIRNPLDFYHKKLLKINEDFEVEETVADNTLGTVIHNTLEDLYKPLEGKYLSEELLSQMMPKISDLIAHHFRQIYNSEAISSGKNLIIYEVAKRYVSNFINLEITSIKKGNTIKIVSIENDVETVFKIDKLSKPIKLKGKVDRIDEFNGITRIVDYKSGRVDGTQLQISDWSQIILDYEGYSKAFQVLCYIFLLVSTKKVLLPVEAGIVSFKNLQSGFLKLTLKFPDTNKDKSTLVDLDDVKLFKEQLEKLILEICNPSIGFLEKKPKN